MAVTIKTPEEVEKLREGGKRLARVLKILRGKVEPGASSFMFEELAQKLIAEGGDFPAFLNYRSRGSKRAFPSALCFSVNEEIVHGVSSGTEKILKSGDIVSLDLGIVHQGLYTDSAVTVPVGEVSEEVKKLLKVTEKALRVGIKSVRAGVTTGDVGHAIEEFVRPYGYGIVRELAGHGVGYDVHEDPYVPNYGRPGEGVELKAGMVIAIEPMLTIGKPALKLGSDGFAYVTKDGSLSAHFEHTVVVTKRGADILTVV